MNDDDDEMRHDTTTHAWEPDHEDGTMAAADDDVIKLKLTLVAPSGTGDVTLTVPSQLKIFDDAGSVETSPITVDISSPSGPLENTASVLVVAVLALAPLAASASIPSRMAVSSVSGV